MVWFSSDDDLGDLEIFSFHQLIVAKIIRKFFGNNRFKMKREQKQN